jgi:outer membrane protein assembly factor BamB
LIGEQGKTGVTATTALAAYDPATGRQAWYVELPGTTNGGSLVTAGDVLMQATGTDFYAIDARSGAQLFKHPMGRGTRASPLTYRAGGKQHVAIVAMNTIIALALPSAK